MLCVSILAKAGFAYRLYRLKPRVSISKGSPANCDMHWVNCRYMISSRITRQDFMP